MLNCAIPSTTLTDLSSVIPKTKDCPLNCLLVATTEPFLRTTVGGAGETDEISQKKLTVAFAAFFDRGRYPIFLANETTFSLNVALSIKTSLDTILALYEVIYVLYAKTFNIVDKLEPSKS